MPEATRERRSTAVSIDLLGLKDQWIAWCKGQGVTPSRAFRSIVQRLTGVTEAGVASAVLQGPALRTEPPGEATIRRITLRLTPSELSAVRLRAKPLGMTPSLWMRSLLRSVLTREPQLGEQELEVVIQSTTQLRYIGRNLNQVARGLNASPHERLIYKVELIEELEAAIKAHTDVVSRLLAANVERWRIVE